MTLAFKRATKLESRLRLALIGPTGSGKTYSALAIASGLGQRIAVIDTEHGSAAKYADRFGEYDTLELQSFAPASYVEALDLAGREGYDVVIVDSLSHAWMGKDGALEQVDRAAKRSSGNSFAAWRDVTPQHNALVEACLRCPAHLIVTMRSKTEYVLEEDSRGKKVPKKVGMAPIQRDGLEYEFDVVAELNTDHDLVITKTRMPELDGVVTRNPGQALGAKIAMWTRGERAQPKPEERKSAPPPPPAASVGPAFAVSWPDKAWAGKPLQGAPGNVLSDYAAWVQATIDDPKRERLHKKAQQSMADVEAELQRLLDEEAERAMSGSDAPAKPDDVAVRLQQQIDAGRSEPSEDGNASWGLEAPQ